MKLTNRLFIYRKKLIRPYIDLILHILNSICILASVFFLVTILFEYGFILSSEERGVVRLIYDISLRLFLAKSVLHIIFDSKETRSQYGSLALIFTTFLMLASIPIFFGEPTNSVFGFVWNIFNHRFFQLAVLASISILQLSNGIVKILSRRVNPSFIFSASFLVIILMGAGLLLLPRATYEPISFVDALFISTSATCVTGLSTVDIATTFTPMGVTFIMILIQVGGLGVMTITSFFALFFMGNASLSNQTLLSDMVSSKSLNSLLTTLLYILGFTAVIEIVGAISIFVDIHSTMGMTLREEIAFSIFHSISAFCNAGFSTLPSNLGNEMLMTDHNPFFLTISTLIVLGGIGFPILVNLYDWVQYTFNRLKKIYSGRSHEFERQVHIYDINTKIVVRVTLILIIVGSLAIGVMEWNRAFWGMPVADKIVQSIFTAVTPRTAGFSSVAMGSFGMQTILLMIFLMVIGGGSQSTAGGVKVNTFAVILLNIKAILQGEDRVILFNRTLSFDSIRRSNSTLVLYTLFVFIATFLLTAFEPDAPILSLVFEAISALSTVGASLDLTATLGSDSKVVLIVLMFVGRVGVLTIMASFIRQKSLKGVRYPSGNIIIN